MSNFGNAAVAIFTFALLATLPIINDVDGKPPKRIAGGENATEADKLTYVVSLAHSGNNDQHFCGGAIISPRHILTAGHCIYGDTLQIVVRSGARNLRKDAPRESNVARIVAHPNYTLQTTYRPVENDIAILVLHEDLDLNDGKTSQISLPTVRPEIDKFGQVAGWGASSLDSSTQHIELQKATVRLLDHQECWFRGANYRRPLKICGYNPKATICVGDSGSPLVSNNEVIGVASASWCKIGQAHLYTSVYEYRDWIKFVIGQT